MKQPNKDTKMFSSDCCRLDVNCSPATGIDTCVNCGKVCKIIEQEVN